MGLHGLRRVVDGIRRAIFAMALVLSSVIARSQDLIAHYDFNNRLTDRSVFGNHGRMVGNMVMVPDRFGRPCGALYLDGASYMEVPSSASLESPSNALTIAVWFQLPRGTGQPRWITIACKGNTRQETPSSPQYRLQVQQNTQSIFSICSPFVEAPSSTVSMCTGFTRCDPAFLSYAFQPATWTFFALVYDGVTVKCFSQGKKVFEEPYSGTLVPNGEPLTVGLDVPGQVEYHMGALDDLKIFNRALTELEVTDLFQRDDKGASDNIEIENLPNMQARADVGSCGAVIDFPSPRTGSECSGPVVVRQVLGPKPGTMFPVGRTRVEFEAVSATGKSVRSGFFVTVKDEVPPTLDIPGDQTVEVPYSDSTFATPTVTPNAADPCGIRTIVQKEGPRKNQLLKPGSYRQTFEAVDVNGNRSERSRNLYIVRLAAPPPVVATRTKVDDPKPPVVPHAPADSVNKPAPQVSIPPQPQPKVPVPNDTGVTASRIDIFKKRTIEVSRQIEVESDSITVYLYDNGIIDDDTVSLYYNGNLLLDRKRISDVPYELRFGVDSLKDNLLSLFAENLGSIPPNTAYLVILDGSNRQELELASTEKKNGTLLIRRRKRR